MASPLQQSSAKTDSGEGILNNTYARSAAHAVGLPPFFAVSVRKFATLSLCTLGLYALYWCYRHWQSIRTWSPQSEFSAARRTMLFFVYIFPLFRRVRALDVEVNGRSSLWPTTLALLYIGINLFDMLPSPYWLLALLSFLPLLPVQASANRLNVQLCTQAKFDRNDRLRGWDIPVVLVGLVLLVLSVVAAFYES